MIKISGTELDINTIIDQYKNHSIERYTLNKLFSSVHIYDYNSLDELKFELNMRKNIVNASIELDRSDFSFSVFRKSRCNTDFWERTKQGGFLLKEGVKPSVAINDIYKNSRKYATECATAMVIVYYRAFLDSFSEKFFDATFSRIYLMNWYYVDDHLKLHTSDTIADDLPGDCRYFQNPQVNPLTPEWQGENVIDLGNGKYYGHGIGIRTSDEIIAALNTRRIIWATESAYLLDSAKRPNFQQLAHIY
ncbi:protein-glutamine gamma-glutamyltransferase [Clostridium sp. Mt-5]|uniref:Protein-glutamine gamma-glutamyltransferase n=1 Tax=Clostridium moutaii TaxID=3240932 RepID=A0ABV4BKF8_9CLOT